MAEALMGFNEDWVIDVDAVRCDYTKPIGAGGFAQVGVGFSAYAGHAMLACLCMALRCLRAFADGLPLPPPPLCFHDSSNAALRAAVPSSSFSSYCHSRPVHFCYVTFFPRPWLVVAPA